jgi:hypothetical protein
MWPGWRPEGQAARKGRCLLINKDEDVHPVGNLCSHLLLLKLCIGEGRWEFTHASVA